MSLAACSFAGLAFLAVDISLVDWNRSDSDDSSDTESARLSINSIVAAELFSDLAITSACKNQMSLVTNLFLVI